MHRMEPLHATTSSAAGLPVVAFVGGGNMSSALIGGLIKAGADSARILVVEPFAEQRVRLGQRFAGLELLAAPGASLRTAQVVVWAVKPQQFAQAAADSRAYLGDALHVSIMAGVRCGAIARQTGASRMVRTMPNTPALIGRGITGLFASVQASAADLQSARLSVQATLAQDYFLLRVADASRKLLDDTVLAYEKSLQVTRNRYVEGVAARGDVVAAETQLKAAQAQAVNVGVQRAQLEHAIAVLTGRAPAEFSIALAAFNPVLPQIPAGVPSALLERRPDIASAERTAAAANARIGVAQAAFYPDLTLTGSAGFQSSTLVQWLSLPSRFWALGPVLAQTLFDGGLRRAQTEQAMAAYDQSVANYRQTALAAFQDVEDNLAALRILEQQAQLQDEAVRAARDSVAIATNQYLAGTVSYLDVVNVQTIALTNERAALAILGSRLTASVLLVKALGGGWNADALNDLAASASPPTGTMPVTQ
ncbi:outer membrane protein OprM precursor [mine drainage metagenome]|uniref:Outer membrane protein OprM n=1 Tax=mine drainage metagenome TaxID=410659 RepID=A0A1J5PM80_9ZZZZ